MKPFFTTVGVLLALAVGFNYAVDPDYLWHGGNFAFSRDWPAGRLFVFPSNLSDRALKAAAQLRVIAAPDVLVLGSSRSMPVDSSFFAPGLGLYNASMVGASVEDYASVWQELKERGTTPRWLVVFADPWILNRNSEQIRWRENLDLFERFRRDAGLSAQPLARRGFFHIPAPAPRLEHGGLAGAASAGTCS